MVDRSSEPPNGSEAYHPGAVLRRIRYRSGLTLRHHAEHRDEPMGRSSRVSTGLPAIDGALDGGLPRGGHTAVLYPSGADTVRFAMALGAEGLDRQLAFVLLPRTDITRDRLDGILDRLGVSLEVLLDRDQLFLLDVTGGWEAEDPNVFRVDSRSALERAVPEAVSRAESRGSYHVIEVTAAVEHLGQDAVSGLAAWYTETGIRSRDVLVSFLDVDSVPDAVSEEYRRAADQVIRFETAADGERLLLETSEGVPTARFGLEGIDERPFLRADRRG